MNLKFNCRKFFVILFIANIFSIFAQNSAGTSAITAIEKSLEQDTVEKSIEYLLSQIENEKSNLDKRILFAFTGSIQEQASLYKDASTSFAKAAGISVSQAEINSFILKKDARPAEKIAYNMLKKTSGILVLDAVRCSLNCGDSKTARSYLNSSVRNSKDEKIIAKIKLYELWCGLCEAQSESDLDEIIVMLNAYSKMQSMESVMTSILFSLWYISEDKSAADILTTKFPGSIESSIVTGNSSLMPTPFWFFVVRKGNALADANNTKANSISSEKSVSIEVAKTDEVQNKSGSSESEKVKRQQVGLFAKKENAQVLANRLKEKGFDAVIEKETRASGNVYYIVIVDENEKGNMGMLLKTAGFDCYPIFN